MRDEILSNLDKPGQLEKLYRANKAEFKKDFSELYPKLSGNAVANFWYERLNFESEGISWGSKKELIFVVIASIIAGLLAKIPAIFSLDEEFFYSRNISFIILPALTAYFAWKNKIPPVKIALLIGILVVCVAYINLLPKSADSDTLILACIHLPFILWVLLGVSFAGNELGNYRTRLDFLRFNGDTAVMTALLGIAGGLITAITIGLFSLIGFEIEEFYFQYIVVFGLPAVPLVATYLTQTNPQLVNKVSPIIAKLFSPVVLVMLVVYLGAIIFSGKDPYNDREFLLMFNLLLIGVLGLISFSVAESSVKENYTSGIWILLLLATVTIIVNGIALSAILFRISEWGITPNRLAVLGSNILILVHLLMVTWKLYGTVKKKSALSGVGRWIVKYIPIYFIWAVVVVFIFPLVFDFK